MTHSYVTYVKFVCSYVHTYCSDWTQMVAHTYVWLLCIHAAVTPLITNTPREQICETWLIYILDMTHSYARHDSFIGETWLIHRWNMTHSYVWHDAFMRVTRINMSYGWFVTHSYTWRIHMCDTHAYVRHNYICMILQSPHWLPPRLQHNCVTWLIPMRDMNHSCVRHDSSMCVTWRIHTWDMTHSYVRHDSFIRAIRET